MFKLDWHTEVTDIVTLENVSLGLMNWGSTNSFPQTLKNLVAQSPNAKPAVSRTAAFLRGGHFEGEDIVVGNNGETLGEIVDQLADDHSLFEAHAIHCNINLEGKVSSIQVMEIPSLRFNSFDQINYSNKLGYHPNFALNSEVVKTKQHSVTKGQIKWIDRFNPDPEVIAEQVESCEGGLISNYNGQILYVSNSGYSRYPIPPLQAQINFVLSDIENSILVRKETSTGFIDTYIYKTTADADDRRVTEFQDAVIEAQGARGSGKIIKMSGLSEEEMKSNVLERIESDKASIIDLSIKAFELTKLQITGAYLIPPALAGIDQKSGFSGEDLKEAYEVFNAITQSGRNKIQQTVNKVLKVGNFPIKEIKLTPLKLDVESIEKGEVSNNDNQANSIVTNLTGKQFQGIDRIVRKYRKADDPLTLDAARKMLKMGFGFDQETADSFLIEDNNIGEEVENV